MYIILEIQGAILEEFIMAQLNESNLRGIHAIWSNHTKEPPQSWTHWSDQFQLAIIA